MEDPAWDIDEYDEFGELQFILKEELYERKKEELDYFEENFLFTPAYNRFIDRSLTSMYKYNYITTDIIADYLKDLASLDADSHLLIVGQNGIGKSTAAFDIGQRIEDLKVENVIFSTDTPAIALEKMNYDGSKVIIIDEAELLLGSTDFFYNRNLTRFMQAIRYKNKIYLACAIEYFAIEKEYRDHKVQLVLWLIERNNREALGLLFASFPTIGNKEDKFDLYKLNSISFYNLSDFVNYAMYNVSSFLGLVQVPKFEVPKWYTYEKIRGAELLKQQYQEKLRKKKK